MDIKINGKITSVSDENEELLNELVNRIINEDVAGATGEMDFDVESPTKDVFIYGTLSVNYEIDDPIVPEYPKIDGTIEMMDSGEFPASDDTEKYDGSKEPMD